MYGLTQYHKAFACNVHVQAHSRVKRHYIWQRGREKEISRERGREREIEREGDMEIDDCQKDAS